MVKVQALNKLSEMISWYCHTSGGYGVCFRTKKGDRVGITVALFYRYSSFEVWFLFIEY